VQITAFFLESVVSFPAMTNVPLNPSPQFGTAEYVGTPGGDHCQHCHQPIGPTYYRVNTWMACPSCADKARSDLGQESSGAFVRATAFGFGAAALGLALYAAFMIATKLSIGYASLAVGWMVGKAMITGSGGITGRKYQIVAAVLTYAACTLARVPLYYTPGLSAADAGRLIFEALVFPLTRFGNNLVGGLLGIVILFVGVSIAIRMTAAKPLVIDGPFENTVRP
jgi:hypothetical protein